MSINIEVRKKQLQSLDQYISSSKEKVESILGYLGWTSNKVREKKDEISCPLNIRHKIHFEKIGKHLETCSIRTAGYDPEEQFLSEPLHSVNSVTLDNNQKIEILNEARCSNVKFRQAWNGVDPDPMTSDRLVSTFSPDERLALYEYCISNTEPPPTPSEFTLKLDDSEEKKVDKQLTEEELREQIRDAKRRRTKYKSVHTGRNKCYTEVMRQVIENQMDLYREYLVDKLRLEKEVEQKRLEDAYEQFDQPDASNIIYDFDADPNSVGSNVENQYTNFDLVYSEFTEEPLPESSEHRSNHSSESANQVQGEQDQERRRTDRYDEHKRSSRQSTREKDGRRWSRSHSRLRKGNRTSYEERRSRERRNGSRLSRERREPRYHSDRRH